MLSVLAAGEGNSGESARNHAGVESMQPGEEASNASHMAGHRIEVPVLAVVVAC